MTAVVTRAAAGHIPALLPLVEQYWAFEDVAGYDPARVGTGLTAEIDEFFVLPSCRGRGNDAAREFYRRHGYSDRAGFALLDKMLDLR